MADFSKKTKTKKVVFTKDYGNGEYYKKDETHYIHENTVKQLDLNKIAKVEDVDFKSEYAKAKAADRAATKAQEEANK